MFHRLSMVTLLTKGVNRSKLFNQSDKPIGDESTCQALFRPGSFILIDIL
jgi:hypothetical protein